MKMRFYVGLILSFASSVCFAEFVNIDSSDTKLLSLQEMRFCYISFVKVDGKKYLVKQKNKINKILGAVRDAITAWIAESLNLAHKVDVIPAGKEFPGKVIVEWPATIHTIAPGKMIKKLDTFYKKMNIKQANIGFRRDMLPWMAKHPTLTKVVALDTFICNHDRHRGNLFYDEKNDAFCAIDMDSSFKYSLGALACENFIKMLANDTLFPLKTSEFRALIEYRNTLQFLLKQYTPEDIIAKFNYFIKTAGFVEGSPLYTEKIRLELGRNKEMIKKNYEDVKHLVEILNGIIKRAVRS